MTPIKDAPAFERPREKLAEKGPAALRKEELIAILLRTGTTNKSALQVAQNVTKQYPGTTIADVYHAELQNMHGVGPTKAAHVLAAVELGRRLFRKEDEQDTIYVRTAGDAKKVLNTLAANKKEHFCALYLDARNALIHKETISIGTVNASLVHPREVFAPALQHNAVSVILAHNHPSDDPEPSREDLAITKKLTDAGKLLGISVTDHVILTRDSHYSFADHNLL